MKKLLFIIIIIVFFGICHAQTTQFEKPRYLKHATLLCPIDITKSYSNEGLIGANKATITINPEKRDTILIKTILIEKGFAYDVVQQIGSFTIIKFWKLSESSGKGLYKELIDNINKDTKFNNILNLDKTFETMKIKGLNASIDNVGYDLSKSYYIVPTKTLINNSIEFENKSGLWNIGLLVLPIKIRPLATESGQFDFSNGFSVGTTFACTAHHNWETNFTHSFLIYAGISSYKADANKIKEIRNEYTIATFSPALGWMCEKNNVQLSILVGIDFPAGNLQQKWVYRNQPWVGIGIGIALFKINSDTQTKSGENKPL